VAFGGDDVVDSLFPSASEREKKFDDIETDLVRKNKDGLLGLLKSTRRPVVKQIELEMAQALVDAWFTEVVTPSIISREFIIRMGITEDHDLWRQIFWIDARRCLRSMLAPNLYHVMRHLRKVSNPVSIFQVGSCFRKESRGREHAEEFTMLNAVELALQKNASDWLKERIEISLRAVGMTEYGLQEVESEVYGETVDVVLKGVEVTSGATSPHPLDANWLVIDPWAGVGFGLESLAMVRKASKVLGHVSRSLSHLSKIERSRDEVY
jgi:pyrrolysyl-tRNA synthetase-like protein